MRGGNRTDRKEYTREYIESLVDSYKHNKCKLYNPLTGKKYKDYKQWFTNIVFWMDKPSANYFFYLLEPPHYSQYSGIPLTEESFSYSDTYKGWKGWKKYTPREIEQRVWMKLRNYKKTESEKKRIKESLIEYNQSDKGVSQRRCKSKRMKSFYNTVEGQQHKRNCSKKSSKTLKRRIANGEITPNITNTWTHWNAKIILDNGAERKFRSSWEACFWYCNQHCKYENIRVKTEKKVYVSDFYDETTNTLYEIKPRNRYNIEIDKMVSLQNYCDEHGIAFRWINEENILQYIDESKFTGINLEQLNKMKQAYGNIKN